MYLVFNDNNLIVLFDSDDYFSFISFAIRNLEIYNIVVLIKTLNLFDFILGFVMLLKNPNFIFLNFRRFVEYYLDFLMIS